MPPQWHPPAPRARATSGDPWVDGDARPADPWGRNYRVTRL